MYENILFDLDGTITDPVIGITNSVIYALKKFNIYVSERKDLYPFIGPPLADSFEIQYGFSKEEAMTAVEYYREYYRQKGIYENLDYDGIEDLLAALKDKGKTLILATSKPAVFAKQILEHFTIAKYFTFIAGSNLDGTRAVKSEVIQYALNNCNICDFSNTIMIGDRKYDIIGAKDVGIHSIGVLYGYGDLNELESAGADYFVESPKDIKDIVQ